MTIIKALDFKYDLNKGLKRYNYDFETFFSHGDAMFLALFAEFLITRIGQIWLTKRIGQAYLYWQQSQYIKGN